MTEEKSEGKFCGVDVLLSRMESHPEEFFEATGNRLSVDKYASGGRWAFLYKDYFKDCLTESEKGRIHEGLRKVRRLEFDAMVLKELMRDEEAEKRREEQYAYAQAQTGRAVIGTPGQYQFGDQNAATTLWVSNSTTNTLLSSDGSIGIGTSASGVQATVRPSPFGAVPKESE